MLNNNHIIESEYVHKIFYIYNHLRIFLKFNAFINMAEPIHIVTGMSFGKESQHMTCLQCHANISTRVETEANTKTHLIALILCLGG